MLLYIDTSNRDTIVIGLDDERFETLATKQKSQKLLPFLDEILRKNGKTANAISEITVVTHKGSYTGLRVGVTVAETLGWALKIPVNGKRIDKGEKITINY
ncbi:MAG: Glycoprotease [Candidatus Woesebacteria bacterium GW2011_GWA1_39_8]|jgi:tRNA threonylcarbamoyladenosine biosynthesis protein TsaB|uniref:Glycoprotease n=1 Tax=Candidatus Woesebacteria bacterium GW2011_GWA1_39_8 TaxID=1618552 RepID=A0A0G0STK6_9BACT|nr:MAG: Glycoprotease [Candidatus Woesebacteria bacterium GW2011_GWA1_39_8]